MSRSCRRSSSWAPRSSRTSPTDGFARPSRARLIGQAGVMGSQRKPWWPALAIAAGAVTLSVLVSGGTAAAAKKGTTLAKAPALARSGHAAFWDCPAKTTELLVAVNTLTLDPGATLDVSFTVRNSGPSPCNYTAPYAGVAPGPTSTALTAGLCGSLGFQVKDSHHHTVWPGAQVVNCPALLSLAQDRGTRTSRTARAEWHQGPTGSSSSTRHSASPFMSQSPEPCR